MTISIIVSYFHLYVSYVVKITQVLLQAEIIDVLLNM